MTWNQSSQQKRYLTIRKRMNKVRKKRKETDQEKNGKFLNTLLWDAKLNMGLRRMFINILGKNQRFKTEKGKMKTAKSKINEKTGGILLPAMGQNNGEHFCYVVPLNKKSKTIILYFSQTIICSVEYKCFLPTKQGRKSI